MSKRSKACESRLSVILKVLRNSETKRGACATSILRSTRVRHATSVSEQFLTKSSMCSLVRMPSIVSVFKSIWKAISRKICMSRTSWKLWMLPKARFRQSEEWPSISIVRDNSRSQEEWQQARCRRAWDLERRSKTIHSFQALKISSCQLPSSKKVWPPVKESTRKRDRSWTRASKKQFARTWRWSTMSLRKNVSSVVRSLSTWSTMKSNQLQKNQTLQTLEFNDSMEQQSRKIPKWCSLQMMNGKLSEEED